MYTLCTTMNFLISGKVRGVGCVTVLFVVVTGVMTRLMSEIEIRKGQCTVDGVCIDPVTFSDLKPRLNNYIF